MIVSALKSMTIPHTGPLDRVIGWLSVWRERYVQRAQLGRLTEEELHDIGLSRGTIAAELDKPFWRG